MKEQNPFVIHGYSTPETFCDREAETQKLLRAVENGRNVTLLAERRIGKTGLICHLFHQLKAQGSRPCILVDIFATQNLLEFTKCFASAVIGSMDTNFDRALQVATGFFKSFRPSLTVDSVTGSPTLSFGLQSLPVEATLKECFNYLSAKGPCVVALDEFQQVANYPEAGTEALLRGFVQQLPEARFIFAGSRHHLMTEMFASAKRPFYNSTQTLPLGRIDSEKYFAFARRHMAAAGVELSRDVFDLVYGMFDGVTWNVQVMLNRLYERRQAERTDVQAVVWELLQEKSWEYAALLKSLPAGVVRLLKAVARTHCVKEPTSAAFLSENALHGASSVRLSIKKALEDELLYESEEGLVVYDRLFAIWLSRLP